MISDISFQSLEFHHFQHQQIWKIIFLHLQLVLFGWVTYVLPSSRISLKSGALILRYSQKKEWISFIFYCFENPLIAHDFGTTDPIQVGFSAKCTSPNEHFNQIENWKCHIFDFRLISLDHITYKEVWQVQGGTHKTFNAKAPFSVVYLLLFDNHLYIKLININNL